MPGPGLQKNGQLVLSLDARLFTRTSRKVALTAYRELLLPYAQTISGAQYEYCAAFFNRRESVGKVLAIGTIPSIAQYHITDLILHFRDQNPSVKVNIMEGDSLEVRQWILEQKCDLAFLREYDCYPWTDQEQEHRLCRMPFTSDYLTAVLSPSHPLANRQAQSAPPGRQGGKASFSTVRIVPEITPRISLCHMKDVVPSTAARHFINSIPALFSPIAELLS